MEENNIVHQARFFRYFRPAHHAESLCSPAHHCCLGRLYWVPSLYSTILYPHLLVLPLQAADRRQRQGVVGDQPYLLEAAR